MEIEEGYDNERNWRLRKFQSLISKRRYKLAYLNSFFCVASTISYLHHLRIWALILAGFSLIITALIVSVKKNKKDRGYYLLNIWTIAFIIAFILISILLLFYP